MGKVEVLFSLGDIVLIGALVLRTAFQGHVSLYVIQWTIQYSVLGRECSK